MFKIKIGILISFFCFLSVCFISNTVSAQTAADFGGVNGGSIRLGDDSEACNGAKAGAIRYNSSTNCAEYCNGSDWTCPNSSSSSSAIFGFPALENVPVSSLEESAILRATLSASQTISISGDGSPEYRICADQSCSSVNHTWTSSSGTLDNNEYVQLRLNSNASVSTINTATLTVGSSSLDWNVTTTAVLVRYVFATQGTWLGNHGGISGADAKCQAEADTEGLSGTYKAWISDGVSDPDNSFNKYGSDYVLTDGTVVANGWSDLTDGTIDNPIDVYVDGTSYSSGLSGAFTNVDVDGTAVVTGSSSSNCLGFTSSSGFRTAAIGMINSTDSWWTNRTNNNCSNGARLWCFQQ